MKTTPTTFTNPQRASARREDHISAPATLPYSLFAPAMPALPDLPPTVEEPVTVTPVKPLPAVPTIEGIYDNRNGEKPIGPGEVTFDTTPLLRGTAEPSSFVAILDHQHKLLGFAMVDDNGNWKYSLPEGLSGMQHVYAQAVDVENDLQLIGEPGNMVAVSVYEMTLNFVIANEGNNPGMLEDGARTEDTTPLISGKTTPGAIVVIRENGNLLHSFKADPTSGGWLWTPRVPLDGGQHELTFSVQDEQGNEHLSDIRFTLLIDAPAPVIPEPEPGPVIEGVYDNRNGEQLIDQHGITFDTTPVLRGTAAPSSFIAILDGQHTMIGFAVVDDKGNWRYTLREGLSGEQQFYAQAVDLNTMQLIGEPGNSVHFSVYEMTINFAFANEGQHPGMLQQGAYTDDATPIISGSSAPDSLIFVRDNGILLHSFKVDASGGWLWTPPLPLSAGQHTLTFNLKDEKGVEHSSGTQFTLNVESPAPRAVDPLLLEGENLLFAVPESEFTAHQPTEPVGHAPVTVPLTDEWDIRDAGY